VGTLSLKGRNLLLVNVPEARISASPDLRFDVDKRRIDVTGQVTIPFAKIAPADLAGAVRTSADEVVVASQMRPPKEQWAVAARVRLVLGDAASIDTFGLSGRLGGALDTRLDTDGSSRGTGELTISEGKYAAFGRRLDVERGKLIFSGGLLTDPGVDIRATKQFPDAVAGVNVRGTLRQPRMTFFSEPSMPQSQIVSLILAGGSIATAQNAVDATGARGDLLAQGGAILAQQLGQKVGLEDVSIEQNLANETAVVLGKYLSPRLYVSYGISLTESLNTVKMRYSLSDRWTIRTEAGRESSADLVYTIEK
jgi:translocation and assembly module TamB